MLIKGNNKKQISTDLLIIGGGINGCAIARDAAGRGLHVTLCEKDDLASHTSSASTKLIHGGLRYLENYDFSLVKHSLKEREILLNSAPHIIWPLRFILPHHKGLRPRWLLRLGLFLYDHIGGRKKLPVSNGVNLKKHAAGEFLNPQFTHAFEYSDCWVQDSRLVVLNARAAAQLDATILTHTACTELNRFTNNWVASVKNSHTGETIQISARAIINASGPWVDNTLNLYSKKNSARSIRLIKGSHIIVKKLFDHNYPYIFQNTDGRILFAIPYEQEFTLLGTTDVNFQGNPDEVKISPQEIDYICEAISQYTDRAVTPAQVIWSYSGVRPLFDDNAGKASKVSRDYHLELDTSEAAVVSVYGGKITTSRILAEQVLDLLESPLQIHKPAWTENSTLPGGDIEPSDFSKFLANCKEKYNWLDASIVLDYCRNYGSDIHLILNGYKKLQELGHYFGGGLYECEVHYLIQNEWASNAEDILWRRTRKGLKMTQQEIDNLQKWLTKTENSIPFHHN